MNLATDGTYDLVKMREDLLQLLREEPDLAPIDDDFAHLFGSWFNRGFFNAQANRLEHPSVHSGKNHPL